MGVFRNCADVWCMPIPPCQVDFRAYVDEVKPHVPAYNSPTNSMQQQEQGMAPGMQQGQALGGQEAGWQYDAPHSAGPYAMGQYQNGQSDPPLSAGVGSMASMYTANNSSANSTQWQQPPDLQPGFTYTPQQVPPQVQMPIQQEMAQYKPAA